MKSKRNGFIFSWVLSLTLSASLIATPAYAKRDNRKKADNICKKYKENMAIEQQICRSQAGHPEEVEECRVTAEHKVGQLREYCNAYETMILNRNLNTTAASIYTAASVICGTACAASEVPWLKAMQMACTVVSITASAADIAGTIASQVKFKNASEDSLWISDRDKRTSRTGYLSTAMGGAAGVLGGAASGTFKGVGEGAKRTGSGNAMCWVSFALVTATATLKWTNIGLLAKSVRSTEDEIIKLQPNSTEPTSVDDGALASSSESGTGNGSPGGPQAFGGSDGPGVEDPFADGDKLLQTMAAASASPDLTDHLNKNGAEFKNLGDQLKSLGIDPAAFHSEVMANGPAATLGKLGLTDSGKELVADIDDKAKAAMLAAGDTAKYGGGGSRTPASSGGGGAMDLSGLMGAFGAGGAGAGAAAGAQIATVNFGSNADTDIWHSKHKGSIFDIVSHKLNKTGDRLEKLDYALPMNRALAR